VSGDREGKVYLAHYSTGEIGGLLGVHADSVESIAMSSEMSLCVSGAIDPNLHIYDIGSMELRSKVTPQEYGGYSKVGFSKLNPHVLYAGSTLGDLHMIDSRDGSVVKTFKGHAASITDFVEVPERQWIVTSGEDRQCLVFDLNKH